MHCVVAHRVGGLENRDKICRHRRKHHRLPGPGHQSAGGYQDKANRDAESGKGLRVRQHCECDNRCDSGGEDGAHRETHRCSVGLVGSRREQDDADRGKGDGPRAVRPFGNDPEELGGTDHDERAPRVDERREPIGHAKADDAAARNRSSGIGNKQRQPVERVRDAGQHFRRLIGEQPQRRRVRRKGDQPAYRLLANPAQPDGVGYPAGRLALR